VIGATVDVVIWSSVEPGVGITAISLATIRPLVRKYLGISGLSKPTDQPSYPRRESLTAEHAKSVESTNNSTLDKSRDTDITIVKTFHVDTER
jgi:hypothetical protein